MITVLSLFVHSNFQPNYENRKSITRFYNYEFYFYELWLLFKEKFLLPIQILEIDSRKGF